MTAAIFYGVFFFTMWVLYVRLFHQPQHNGQSAEEVPVRQQASTEILAIRSKNRELIDAWVKVTRNSKRRESIYGWRFASYDATDKIRIHLEETGWVEGTVKFKDDHDFPRVSSFTYMDGDTVKRIAGVTLPLLSMEAMYKAYVAELNNDVRKIQYINEITNRAMQSKSGTAVFDVCKYEGITRQKFEKLYGLREIKALCKAISDSAGVRLEYNRSQGKVILTPGSEPK